jgi:hypothetical protein
MIIRNLAAQAVGDENIHSAEVVWEDHDFAQQSLSFAIGPGGRVARGDIDEPRAEAFLAACFPLAAVHGEARVKIEGRPCPMLVEGLRTVHAWWQSWGGMPSAAPAIETERARPAVKADGPRRAVAFLSGGVDGLHMLLCNRRLYRHDDPAYIRDALFIHGFDIGKRARDPEHERYRMALRRLEPVAAETGLRVVACRTNLRHLPSKPDFWTYRHNGPALAAMGHAAIATGAWLFIGGTFDVAHPVPMGTHPSTDGLLSSQRLQIVHEGARYSRLAKVRDLARWPTALAALRVCSANIGNEANCGVCEKCLRTRLELLVAGVEETAALGPSLTPNELWERAEPVLTPDHAIIYADLLPILRARGLDALCRIIENRIRIFRERKTPSFGKQARGQKGYFLDGRRHPDQDRDGRPVNASDAGVAGGAGG